MKVAALGRTHLLYDAVREVQARGHEVVLIGTAPAAPEYGKTEDDFARLAAELGCGYFCDSRIASEERIRQLGDCGAQVALSTNWPSVIPERVLDLFPHGIINSHFGDLPRYRGNACPNWAILNGETSIYVTLHKMIVELDAGPVVMQRTIANTENTYIGDVYRFAEQHVPGMFADVVDALEGGTLVERSQPDDPGLALRCFPRISSDSEIDWRLPAVQLARLVRASSEPFSGAYTHLGTDCLVVWRARAEHLLTRFLGTPGQVAERRSSGEVAVCTGDGLLVLETVEIDGRGRVPANAVIRSARTRLGLNIGDELIHLRKRVQELEAQLARWEAALGSELTSGGLPSCEP